jgi:hypothetical protein
MDHRLNNRVLLGASLGAAGIVLLVVGTFLPWLRSGQVQRNSYKTGGDLQRILGTHGLVHAALTVWPFLALATAAVVAVFVVGLRRTAAGVGLLLAIAVGGVAVAALRQHRFGPVAIVYQGPLVTLIGATLLTLAATLVLISADTAANGRS